MDITSQLLWHLACAVEPPIICPGVLWATLDFKAENVVPAAGEDPLVQAPLRELPAFLALHALAVSCATSSSPLVCCHYCFQH